MTAATKLGREEGGHNALVGGEVNEAAREADDVATVVLAEKMGKIGRLDGRGTDAGHFVGHDGHAKPGAADEHAAVSIAAGNRARNLVGIVGVIDGVGRVGAEVEHLVSKRAQVICKGSLLVEAAMIGSDGNAHGDVPFS